MFRIQATEELDFIREKIARRALDYNENELQCMTIVYEQIGKYYNQQYKLKKGCNSCVKDAMNIIYNYITFLEEPTPTKEKNATITNIKIDVSDLTLKQLRELYPEIKSTSKKGFIEQL